MPQVEAEPGLVVEDFEGKFCGAVVAFEKDAVTLEDRHGKRRAFPLPGAFLFDGKRVTLVRPAAQRPAPGAPAKTASGSIAAPQQRAKVARASRIYVEGKHDAELVEKIWGDDLRDVGVVVEYLEGVDDLPAIVEGLPAGPWPAARRARRPPRRRLQGEPDRRRGRPRPARPRRRPPVHRRLGRGQARAARPGARGRTYRREQPWKEGVLRRIGWPTSTPQDVAAAWRRILRAVTSYGDLEPELLGRVEELIDFVTAPEQG